MIKISIAVVIIMAIIQSIAFVVTGKMLAFVMVFFNLWLAYGLFKFEEAFGDNK